MWFRPDWTFGRVLRPGKRCVILGTVSSLLLGWWAIVSVSPVSAASPASPFTFCLRSPAMGQLSWAQRTTQPPVISLALHGLPENTDFGIFVDEGTARLAYEFAYFHTNPTGVMVGTVRAFFFPGPSRVQRLLLQSGTGQVVAVAISCDSQLVALPAAGAGGTADQWRWILIDGGGATFAGTLMVLLVRRCTKGFPRRPGRYQR